MRRLEGKGLAKEDGNDVVWGGRLRVIGIRLGKILSFRLGVKLEDKVE